MTRTELEKVIKTLCGDGYGSASAFAELIGTTPATVSRWRSGETEVNARDEKLMRLICHLRGKLDWAKMAAKPVEQAAGIYEIL